LVSEDPRGGLITKIVDFGVAKIEDLGGEIQMLTRTGEVFGSPAYMSPEQCQGNQVDNRSDIYAIGCVMYEALSGKQAFKGANIMTIMTKQMEDDPIPPEHIEDGEGLPSDVQLLVMTCFAEEPGRTFSIDERTERRAGTPAARSHHQQTSANWLCETAGGFHSGSDITGGARLYR